jgi:hypothetical protein
VYRDEHDGLIFKVNHRNWRALRECNNTYTLVKLVCTFMNRIKTTIFTSDNQIKAMLDELNEFMEHPNREFPQSIYSSGNISKHFSSSETFDQFHVGLLVLLSDFVHLIFANQNQGSQKPSLTYHEALKKMVDTILLANDESRIKKFSEALTYVMEQFGSK